VKKPFYTTQVAGKGFIFLKVLPGHNNYQCHQGIVAGNNAYGCKKVFDYRGIKLFHTLKILVYKNSFVFTVSEGVD
jgi:hypothetical protein